MSLIMIQRKKGGSCTITEHICIISVFDKISIICRTSSFQTFSISFYFFPFFPCLSVICSSLSFHADGPKL